MTVSIWWALAACFMVGIICFIKGGRSGVQMLEEDIGIAGAAFYKGMNVNLATMEFKTTALISRHDPLIERLDWCFSNTLGGFAVAIENEYSVSLHPSTPIADHKGSSLVEITFEDDNDAVMYRLRWGEANAT